MPQFVDLSHTIRDGLVTYRGLPPVHVCQFLSRADSRRHYAPGTEFQIDQLTLVGNSGTYIDSPFHRYADGEDLAALTLAKASHLSGLVIRTPACKPWQAIDASLFRDHRIKGMAVLFHTGWSRHFGTPAYMSEHPFLTEEAANILADAGVALVGIDSHNIDDIRGDARPVHSRLLGDGIPIVEHLTGLDRLPDAGFSFHAAPIKLEGVGTFPVRAYATF